MIRRRNALEVHLYAVCWNEERILPFFFRHYEPWVQRFVIYDNGSTDGTLALLAARPDVEVRQFPWSRPGSFVLSHRDLHNDCWKESCGAARWVVVTAIDEHLHHRDMPGYLGACERQGITCIPALGYDMVTPDFPDPAVHLATTHTRGVPDAMLNKLRLFDPDAVAPHIDIGGHGAAPSGSVVYPRRDEVLLLHYKNLGMAYRAERNRLLATGLREEDREQHFGLHYGMSGDDLGRLFAYLHRDAVDIASPRYRPWLQHPHPRFWRKRGMIATLPHLYGIWRRIRRGYRRLVARQHV